MPSDKQTREILSSARAIAVVGCSSNPEKEAHKIPKYLKERGYKIIPVNPNSQEILGEKCAKSLSEINIQPDIIDVFRPSAECAEVVKEAVKLKPKLIWLQLGIENQEAEEIARQAGIPFIQNRCIMLEHKRLFP